MPNTKASYWQQLSLRCFGFFAVAGLLVSSISGQQTSDTSTSTTSKPRIQIKTVVLYLDKDGFNPSHLTLPSEKIFLQLINNLENEDVSFDLLAQLDGSKLASFSNVKRYRPVPRFLDLTTKSGAVFTISMPNHPDWKCTLEVAQ